LLGEGEVILALKLAVSTTTVNNLWLSKKSKHMENNDVPTGKNPVNNGDRNDSSATNCALHDRVNTFAMKQWQNESSFD